MFEQTFRNIDDVLWKEAGCTTELDYNDPRQQAFLDFVLSQYVAVGESELDGDKLPELLQLKYGTPADAVRALGSVADIRSTFRGFQRGLYDSPDGDAGA